MSDFHFPQYEHELFWRYYDRLHAFLAHYGYCLEKWELLDTVYMGVNYETRALLEQWDFYAKTADEACDFLDWLAWDTHEFETSCSEFYIPPPCIPPHVPTLCDICSCSDHDSSSCPYYISDEGFARLSNMIETMDKQQVEFELKMREFDLSHETDLRISSPRPDVCLCDDGASFPPLESGLEAVIDPSLCTLPLVAPSSPSTLRDNPTFNMLLPDPPLPLAQSTEFKVDGTFNVSVSVDEDDICYESDSIFIEEHESDAVLTGRSHMDVVTVEPTSPDIIDDISHDPLDTLHASPVCSLPSPSPECHSMPFADCHDILEGNEIDCLDSLGTLRGYDPSLDPYILYLGSMPAKIMLTTTFNFFADFSKAFDKFKRALTLIPAFLFKCSYLHWSELHAQTFDKLLRALTASE